MIATGETHTVKEFVMAASKQLDMKIYWTGKKFKEKGYIYENNKWKRSHSWMDIRDREIIDLKKRIEELEK